MSRDFVQQIFGGEPEPELVGYDNASGSVYASAFDNTYSRLSPGFIGVLTPSDTMTSHATLAWRPLNHAATMGGDARKPEKSMIDGGSGMTFDQSLQIATSNGWKGGWSSECGRPDMPEQPGKHLANNKVSQLVEDFDTDMMDHSNAFVRAARERNEARNAELIRTARAEMQDSPTVITISVAPNADLQQRIRVEAEAVVDEYFRRLRGGRRP